MILGELLALAEDLRGLWDAASTTNRDRKEILGGLVDRVVIDAFDAQGIDLTVW